MLYSLRNIDDSAENQLGHLGQQNHSGRVVWVACVPEPRGRHEEALADEQGHVGHEYEQAPFGWEQVFVFDKHFPELLHVLLLLLSLLASVVVVRTLFSKPVVGQLLY